MRNSILLILWMLCTLCLVCTVIGMLLFVPTQFERGLNDPSTWMKVGLKLLNN
jgi:hypothetical protein